MAKAAKRAGKIAGPRVMATDADRDWQVRDALQTIKRAEDIKRDPKMMGAVRTLAKQEKATIDKLARGKA